MHFTTVLVAALASLASARSLTYDEKCGKYKCLTLDTVENWNPPCAAQCYHNILGSSADGCAPDDFRCHCKNAASIAPQMRGCLGANSTGCSSQDLGQIRANFGDMCGFFNQTGYEPYRDCTKLLYSFVTYMAEHDQAAPAPASPTGRR